MTGVAEAQQQLEKLVRALDAVGFSVHVREDDEKCIFLLVAIASDDFLSASLYKSRYLNHTAAHD